jgi:predicted nucleic acid-binding protein
LYFEASPIIMMSPGQRPDWRAITQEFFRIVSENPDEYELVLSPVTLEELRRRVAKLEKNIETLKQTKRK